MQHFQKNKKLLFLLLIISFISSPIFAQEESITALRQMGKAFASIAEKASPAVVGIKSEMVVEGVADPFGQMDPFSQDFFEFFFRGRPYQNQQPPQQKKQYKTAQGSGFIISADGYILTNNHVIKDADKIIISLGEDKEMEAKVIGTDPDSDVAVVKIDINDAPFIKLANSDQLEVGEWVIAIGNPFGLSHSVTAGIVSAKSRSRVGLTNYEDFIQTDAAINPGNSGGPLLNLDGEVVGINTAIVGPGGNIGIGLAIPINMAKYVYEELVQSGTVVRGFLGVGPRDITPEIAEYFGLKEAKGVIIAEIVKDSPAEKAGLKHNDIILELDGKPVDRADTFRNAVAMLKPGTKVEIVVLRDGEKKTFKLELGQKPSDEVAASDSKTQEKVGLTVKDLTPDLAQQLGYENAEGVIVSDVEAGSIAQRKGIRTGELIVEVNKTPVKSVKDFKNVIKDVPKGSTILLLIRDTRYVRYVTLPVEK